MYPIQVTNGSFKNTVYSLYILWYLTLPFFRLRKTMFKTQRGSVSWWHLPGHSNPSHQRTSHLSDHCWATSKRISVCCPSEPRPKSKYSFQLRKVLAISPSICKEILSKSTALVHLFSAEGPAPGGSYVPTMWLSCTSQHAFIHTCVPQFHRGDSESVSQ